MRRRRLPWNSFSSTPVKHLQEIPIKRGGNDLQTVSAWRGKGRDTTNSDCVACHYREHGGNICSPISRSTKPDAESVSSAEDDMVHERPAGSQCIVWAAGLD